MVINKNKNLNHKPHENFELIFKKLWITINDFLRIRLRNRSKGSFLFVLFVVKFLIKFPCYRGVS